MNTRLLQLGRCLLAVVALGTLALVTGCGTTEPDNQSTRPWNAPKSWEGGVPGMLYDRR
jgi:hypothetical protein